MVRGRERERSEDRETRKGGAVATRQVVDCWGVGRAQWCITLGHPMVQNTICTRSTGRRSHTEPHSVSPRAPRRGHAGAERMRMASHRHRARWREGRSGPARPIVLLLALAVLRRQVLRVALFAQRAAQPPAGQGPPRACCSLRGSARGDAAAKQCGRGSGVSRKCLSHRPRL